MGLILGTAITGYVYLWQSVQVAEEQPSEGPPKVRKIDAAISTFFTVAIFWFILIATGATLGVAHRPVNTAEEAAQALAPVAGPYASYLFGVGLLGSALIAVPVLMATTGYAVCAQFDVHRGLSEPVRDAPTLYGVITTSTLAAIVISAIGVPPIRLLFLASIVAGVATPIGLSAMMLVTSDPRLMGTRRSAGLPRRKPWAEVITTARARLIALTSNRSCGIAHIAGSVDLHTVAPFGRIRPLVLSGRSSFQGFRPMPGLGPDGEV